MLSVDDIKQRIDAALNHKPYDGYDKLLCEVIKDSRTLIEELERRNKALDIRCSQMMGEREDLRSQIKELKDTLDSLNAPGGIMGCMPCKVCGAAITKLYAPGGWLCYQCRLEAK